MATGNIISMTTNEEIDAFESGDNTIEITAYVDGIEGTKYVGKANKALFKFTVNNGSGRRMRVLLWEQNAKQYESIIVNREILHIERGLYLPVNKTYFRKEDDVMPFEISLSKSSTINLMGKYMFGDTERPTIISTTIKDCANVEGRLSLTGFIKVTFALMSTNYNSYGSGAIMEDIHKLRIHITNFKENHALVKGAHVKLEGEIRRDKYDSLYLQVDDMDDISIIDDVILGVQELNSGIHAPKRKQRII